MAIENEIKFLCRPAAFADAISVDAGIPVRIEQHYLAPGTRVRCIKGIGQEEFVFTFKRMTPTGLVEIETAITERDFSLLVPTADVSIRKDRLSIDIDGLTWDVDLFETAEGDFVFAEVEMPEGMERPPTLPAFVTDHLVRELGADPQFSNQALAKGGQLAIVGFMANNGTNPAATA